MTKKKIKEFHPTVEERRRALDDIFYEIQQLMGATSIRTNNRIIQNALLESILIHSRNLLDFYGREKRTSRKGEEEDDVLVSDYDFPPEALDVPLEIKERLNKDLAHLTYNRSKRRSLETKRWHYPPIIVPIMKRSTEFIEHLQSNCLHLIAPEHTAAFVADCKGRLTDLNIYLDQYPE